MTLHYIALLDYMVIVMLRGSEDSLLDLRIFLDFLVLNFFLFIALTNVLLCSC